MAFVGKLYAHERDENFDAFVDSLGMAPERSAGLKQFKPAQKLEKNGDTYTLQAVASDETKETSFKLGEEFEEQLSPTRTSKTIYTLDGNTLVEIRKFDHGVIITSKREYFDDKLIVTLTSNKWDGKAVRYYKS